MSLLKQIDDKGAVLEWSPVQTYPNLVALGTKDSSGVGFDDYGGELELHKLDLNSRSPSTILLGKARAKFSSIAWSKMELHREKYPYGLIAGGMNDGFVHIWDPSTLAVGSEMDSLIASIEQHQGGIRGLQFNPHRDSSHLLASGGNDGEVFVMSLERPDQPNVFVPAPPPNSAKHSAEVTKVGWNTQVAYILASAAQNGSCYVWDLRQKKAWCELRDPIGGSVVDIAWNPDQGLNIITASGDDKNPVLKLWDLRSSTSLPLATLQGHSEGILSVSWCPTDPSLVLSCGKDNQTILWDLFLLQPVYNLVASQGTGVHKDVSDQNVFTGLAQSAGQRRYHVSWSPCLPAVIGACSFDRSLQFYSLSGVKSKLGRAPKWLRRPVGASFGFGGKLALFDNGASAATNGSKVKVCQVVEDPILVAGAENFHASITSGDFKSFCEMKSLSAQTPHDRDVWSLMKVIWFENSAREELLKFLGFSAETIDAAVESYVSSKSTGLPSPPRSPIRRPLQLHQNSSSLSLDSPTAKVSAEELFSSPEMIGSLMMSTKDESQDGAANATNTVAKTAYKPSEAELVIAKAIVAGNFAGAVDCCLSAGLLAEALLLAQCGDQSLWLSTQEAFFNLQKSKRPFLSILHAIIKQDLRNYILFSDLSLWRETMAILSTYAKTEEFPILCESLAHRLETEVQDIKSATLCYMCATNVIRVLEFWVDELKAANKLMGMLDTNALQQFVEKVIVFTQANPTQDLGVDTCYFFIEYASILASQGKLDIATYFLKGSNQGETALSDRLYHSGTKPLGLRPPAFPFTKVSVNAPSVTSVTGNVTTNTTAAAANMNNNNSNNNTTNAHAASSSSNAVNGRNGVKSTTTAMSSNSQQVMGTITNRGGSGNNVSQPIIPNAQANIPPLPPGWLELIDPASGKPYYVNQAISKSQWERPASVEIQPLPQPTPVARPVVPTLPQINTTGYPTTNSSPRTITSNVIPANPNVIPSPIPGGNSSMSSSSSTTLASAAVTNSSTSVTLPLPQGHGFTAAHPASIPTVPGIATIPTIPHAVGVNSSIPMSVANPNVMPTVTQSMPTVTSPTIQPVVVPKATPVKPPIQSEAIQALGGLIEQVAGANLSPAERKQIAAINQSYSHLLEKAALGDISIDVVQKIEQLVHDLATRNYPSATAVQTDLANSVWAQHKEWLKGTKILIQLASKH